VINDIKNHPLYLVGVAIVGSVSICILIFKEIVLPTMTIKLQNQVEKLSESENNLQKILLTTQDTLTLKLKELNSTKIKLEELETIHVFETNSPYPATLNKVKIGDLIDKLLEFFDEKNIQKTDTYWTVTSEHAVFPTITYYFDESVIPHTISHIMFSLKGHYFTDKDFLQHKLESSFGEPTKLGKRKNYYVWYGQHHNIYKISSGHYILMLSDQKPRIFPDD